jgi:anti-sigma regulatory factor (Ser/Thr protein kinase)
VELAIALNLSLLPPNVAAIMHYAFTEILNNAIDHSMTDRCRIEARLDATKVAFSVKDDGIGVFQSIAKKFELEDEHAALIELIKGKTTTMPEAHSGEGLFSCPARPIDSPQITPAANRMGSAAG